MLHYKIVADLHEETVEKIAKLEKTLLIVQGKELLIVKKKLDTAIKQLIEIEDFKYGI